MRVQPASFLSTVLSTVALTLCVFLAALTFAVASDTTEKVEAPTATAAVSDSELIALGKYLAIAGNCTGCHTTPGGEYMAGGLPFDTPFGTIYSTNITPDATTGIGGWTDDDFLNSLRHGVRATGEHLYPVFPYTAFTKISDQDVAALYAYFQSIPAISRANNDNDVAFPFNVRALMSIWKLLFFSPGSYEANDSQSDEWNRGAYLVDALGHCSACHTPRNMLGAEEQALFMAGGEYSDLVMPGINKPWSAPNLTGSSRGLGTWSKGDLSAYLSTARNDFLESFGPMNEVIMHSTRHLTETDVRAMAEYLKSLPAIDPRETTEPDKLVMGRGRTIYNLHCGTCHLPTGEGDPEMAPRLNKGSLVVQAANPASMINAILYSPAPPQPALSPKWRKPMEEFQYLLDDDEVAALATFIRHSWDNHAGSVTPQQVARQRWDQP